MTRLWMGAVCGWALLSVTADAQAPAEGQGFDAFRLLRSRNLFDPERRSTRVDNAPPPPTSSSGRANFITLTGTMVTRGKALAFFSGSRPEYSRVATVQEKVADFTVTNITSSHAELLLGAKAITVPVGGQLPLEGSVAATAEPLIPAPSMPPAAVSSAGPLPSAAPGTTSPAAPAGAAPPPATDASDVLRRMMERRQQEMSK